MGMGPQGGAQGHEPQGPMGLKDRGLKDPGPHGGTIITEREPFT